MTVQESNYIKLIAMVTMLIDHAGIILFPDQIIFRIIGRISFPLFAYQLGVGYEHTHNLMKYIRRIFLFGVFVQLLYSVAICQFKVGECLGEFNIFFTLALGLLSICFYNKGKYLYLLLTLLVPIVLGQFGINLDYGIYGVLLILIIYVAKKRPLLLMLFMAILSMIYDFHEGSHTQIFSIIAILFMVHPRSLKFSMPRYIFYWFYPLHLAVLYLIGMMIR